MTLIRPALNSVRFSSAGIVGGADLVPAVHGWDTSAPVARIAVTATG